MERVLQAVGGRLCQLGMFAVDAIEENGHGFEVELRQGELVHAHHPVRQFFKKPELVQLRQAGAATEGFPDPFHDRAPVGNAQVIDET